jgi:hypothetical protein
MTTLTLALWALAAPANAQVRPETRMRDTGSGLVLGGTALGAAAVLSGVLIEGRHQRMLALEQRCGACGTDGRSDWDAFQGQLYVTAPMAVGGLGLVAAGAVMHVRAGHASVTTAPMPLEEGAGVSVSGHF